MTEHHKIRFFNTYEPVITIYRDLAPALARSGFDIELVVSRTLYREDKEPLERLTAATSNVTVRRLFSPVAKASGRISKLLTMFSYLLLMMVTSLFGRAASVNVFLTQPPFSSFWGAILKTLRGQKYACILMDIYPDVLIRDGILKEQGIMARLLRKLVVYSWRRADAIIVIGRCMKEYVVACGVPEGRVHIISNWNDDNAVYPVAKTENPLLSELGLDDQFIVLYSGNLGVSHNFDDITGAARQLRGEEDIKFVFIGSGSRRKQIEKVKGDEELANIILLPYQPFEKLHYSLSMADVHYVCLREGFEGLVVPSKTYPAMASGRPIIFSGHPKGEIYQMIREEAAGTSLALNQSKQLAANILAYRDDPARREKEGQNAAHAMTEKYSKTACIGRYESVFTDLCARKDAG